MTIPFPSFCRLPAPLDTEHEKLDEPWPGHAYTSHICRCDVFPRFDPERTKFDVSSQRKLKQQLLPSTEDALEKLSYSIYSTSVYQEAIKDNKHSPNQSGEACEDNVVSIRNKENTSLIEVEDWEVKDQEEIVGKTENEEEQVEGNLKKGLPKNRPNNLEDNDVETQPHLSVVWPIWPVGLDDMRRTPLNFPKIPLPTYAPQDFTKISQMPSKETTQNIQGGSEENSPKCGSLESTKYENWIRTASKYIPALTAYNSSSLDFGEMKHLRFSNPEHKNLNELGQVRVGLLPVKHLAGVDYVKLPLIPSKQTRERSHEPPQRKLHCTTEMLGIRFKTDAHKRYHEIYSDVIPDLRSSTITGRQHFFWGVHACTLR
ncbi:uncharacterized protein [Porites lutea]|uniref:uncharacterized protein n=1 Tax=Porites lutea TaxID=51062 RepID=UPI003CC68C03